MGDETRERKKGKKGKEEEKKRIQQHHCDFCVVIRLKSVFVSHHNHNVSYRKHRLWCFCCRCRHYCHLSNVTHKMNFSS